MHKKGSSKLVETVNDEIYKSLFMFSIDGIFIIDKETQKIIDLNQAALNMYITLVGIQAVLNHANFGFNFGWFGYILATPQFHHWHHSNDLIDQPITSIYPNEVLPYVETKINELIENGNVKFVTQQQNKEGKLIEVEVKSFVFKSNGRDVFQFIVTDISSRKKNENEAKFVTQKLEAIFSEANIGMVVLNESLKYIEVNKKFCDFVGYSEKELLNLTPIDITSPDDIVKTIKVINNMMEQGGSEEAIIKKYIRRLVLLINNLLHSKPHLI